MSAIKLKDGLNGAVVSATAPSSPSTGDMWFDSTSSITAMKVWNGAQWDQMSNKFTATGGTVSTYTSGGIFYKVHTFTSSGTFTAETAGTIDIVRIAGGGSGGGSTTSTSTMATGEKKKKGKKEGEKKNDNTYTYSKAWMMSQAVQNFL